VAAEPRTVKIGRAELAGRLEHRHIGNRQLAIVQLDQPPFSHRRDRVIDPIENEDVEVAKIARQDEVDNCRRPLAPVR